jgi:Zn-dependent protease with chaperone function/type II secretory pathway pseudopilin PulG
MTLVYKHEKTLFAIAAVVSAIVWVLLVVGTLGIALLYLALAFVVYLFAHSAFIARIKGNGVRVTQEQFPDLHASLLGCCTQLGIERPPDLYLLRTDFFNALATKFLGRDFLVLFTDVVDALADEPGAVDFYIGHELGHVHRKHLKFGPFLFPALLLPVLGPAYRRAQEYTCDRYGTACCRSEAQVRAALGAIAAGNTRWKTLDAPRYLAQVGDTAGFWMSFHELTSDYPWLTKRMATALALVRGEEVGHPRRSALAGILAIFVPRLGIAGGGPVGLLAIVAVIGVLAAVALPAYQDYALRAQATAALADTDELRDAVEQYYAENREWPADLAALGYDTETLQTSDGRHEIGLYGDGNVAVDLGSDSGGQTRYLIVEPTVDDDGAVSWTCYGENVAAAMLPGACRR